MNTVRRIRVLASLIGALACASATAATLAPGVQQRLNGATFEVVLGKPAVDPLTYEKPLPLELLPFRERTDKFRSIGTAFAIGPNRFVSAAHVISAGNGSQYAPLALRDAAGKTYRVDKILKFSSSEDYVMFTVVAPPTLVPLLTRPRPPLNTPVFAVGNALGEGVVARDGLYTSDTPEERDGRWQWLRFSAPASPGNSGGPLIDGNGKVIGVILRKSPNENLNFALAIEQVLAGSEQSASFEVRTSYRMMVMKEADSVNVSEKIPLPKTLEDFYAAARQLAQTWDAKIRADYLKNHADKIFPAGNSEQLLTSVYAEAFPKLISLSDGGTWALAGDAPRKQQLDKNGYLQAGVANGVLFARLKTPDDVSTADLITDSKKFMDLMLKAYPVSRPVGTDSVRVTSMGAAASESWFTDSYGRKWQVRFWSLPFSDSVILTVALPTPDGMVMMLAQSPSNVHETFIKEVEAICDFVYVSYTGTLAQWRAFLEQPIALPTSLADLQVQFDYNRGLGIKSTRFEWLVPAAIVNINADSTLMLKYSFMHSVGGTVWDLGGVYLADGEQKLRWVGLLRRIKPSPSLPEEVARGWRTMASAAHPWDGVAFLNGGRTEIDAMVNQKDVAASRTNIGYTLTLSVDGTQPISKMKDEFGALERGFKMTE